MATIERYSTNGVLKLYCHTVKHRDRRHEIEETVKHRARTQSRKDVIKCQKSSTDPNMLVRRNLTKYMIDWTTAPAKSQI